MFSNFSLKPKTLSIMPTFACSAACTNCGTLSHPHEKNHISLETIKSAIKQASNKKLNFGNVVFTGGEATLRWKDLLESISYSVSLKLPTRLVTNAHWARNEQKAHEKLNELIVAGLKEINFSTGDEHVKFVPFENVILATKLALEKGLIVAIMTELKNNREISKESIFSHSLIKNLDQDHLKSLTIHESPWMPLSPSEVEQYPIDVACNNNNLSAKGGCDSLLQTFVIQADGRIGACCGLGMRLVPELNVGRSEGDFFLENSIKNAEIDFLKLWIHYKGPEKIIAWASEKNPEIKWENMYAHKCQACLRMYKDPIIREVIREHYEEMITEVTLTAFIDDVFLPNQIIKHIPMVP